MGIVVGCSTVEVLWVLLLAVVDGGVMVVERWWMNERELWWPWMVLLV